MAAAIVGAVVAGLGVLASLVWLGQLAAALRYLKRVVRMAELPDDPPPGGWPALAVVVAARNEAEHVERAARSLLAQDYPGLEVIVVDDRSTDATGSILDAIAAGDPRLRVVHVRALPDGWLGKNHALHAAAGSTSADWLLFTDADVVFAPGVLRKAAAFAVGREADHVTVTPDIPTEGVGERLFLAMFGLIFMLYSPPWAVEDPDSPAHLGIGAFNLVRAEAFRAIGGFGRLALSVDDDMRLGQALKVAGYRTRVVMGKRAISVRWQVGLGGMIRGLEKNFFAGANYRLGTALVALLVLPVLGAGPHAGLFVGPWSTRAVCALGLGALAVIVGQTGQQSRIAWYYALTLPISAVLMDVALIRSTWITLRRRGIRWRDHHYPIRALREHVRRRNAWTRDVWRSTR